MKIEIDKNNILTIFNENIPQTKEYTYNVSGYLFSSCDKGIIVLHKKERKIIHLKNLGNTMTICYVAPRTEKIVPFDKEGFMRGLCLFDAFDEEQGKTYFFIPKCSEQHITSMNKALEVLKIPAKIEKTKKGCLIKGDIQNTDNPNNYFSFIFALTLLYGKMEIKHNELLAIKIHIPLFGQFMKHEEYLDIMQKQLIKEGIFITTSKQKNNDGIIYQISSNDYELLKNLTNYANGIENITKIVKEDQTLENKKSLIEFLETNSEIPSEGKEEVIKKIQTGTIKLLTK